MYPEQQEKLNDLINQLKNIDLSDCNDSRIDYQLNKIEYSISKLKYLSSKPYRHRNIYERDY